jgi:hypothetical protein
MGMLGTQNTGGNRSGIQIQSKLQWDYFSFHLSYLYNDINNVNQGLNLLK